MSEQVIYVADETGGAQIDIDPNAPWAGWGDPILYNGRLPQVRVADIQNRLTLVRQEDDQAIGALSPDGMQQLGWHAGFPAEFLQKLPDDLQEAVINNLLERATEKEFTFIADGDHFTNLAPGWRQLIPYRETAQFVYNTLRDVYGDDVEVLTASANGRMISRIGLPLTAPVTRKKGDILRAGVEIEQSYGITTQVALYATRLICTNGMTASGEEFKWTQRNQGSRDHQLNWLRQGLQTVTGNFENLVQKAHLMATIEVHANPVDVLREHARAMRLPTRFLGPLVEAFNEEPGNTEWDLLNAFTRLATHGSLPQRTARQVMRASGDWVSDFDMVKCRLPRPLANSIGAEIMEVEDAVPS